MKLIDALIDTFCKANNIPYYLPWKIRAITTLTRASRPKEVSAITLRHGDAEPWGRVLKLIELNYFNGVKDHVIVVDSYWTVDGSEPPDLAVDIATSQEVDISQSKKTQRSQAQTTHY